MKKLTLSLLIPALFLATNSYAETANNNSVEADVVRQCDYYYQKASNPPLPLIKREYAVTVDKEKTAQIEKMRQFAEEYIMDANIADFPLSINSNNYNGGMEIEDALVNISNMHRNDAVEVLTNLFGYYYLGEYVPKDDYQAIIYLKKLVDYYKQMLPEYADELIMVVIYSLSGGISEKNPMWGNDDVNQLFKLFIEADSIEAEALLIVEGYGSSDKDCQASMLPRLTELAEQGSRIAIHELADTYYNKPHEQIAYWRQKAEDNPLAKYESGF